MGPDRGPRPSIRRILGLHRSLSRADAGAQPWSLRRVPNSQNVYPRPVEKVTLLVLLPTGGLLR